MLRQDGGRPAVSFTQYRYTGSRATGDQGTFWGKGVLQFALRFPENAPRLAQARSFLGPRVRVEAIVPTEVLAEVAFAGAEEGSGGGVLGSTRGDLAAPSGEGAGRLWDERSFSLALSPASSRLLADAFARGAVALSVNVVASAPAFRMPPPKGESPGMPEATALTVDAVPVGLDVARYPELVRHLDLDATMAAGYMFLEVACNDFAEGMAFADLGVVVVALTGIAVNGDRITRELRYDAAAPPLQVVKFDRAVRLDRAYEVKIHRIYSSGRSEEDGPRQVEVWSGLLDVSKGPPSEGSQLDPRLLY
ncbi:MAG: hypothetical protein V1750_02165 [Acidobacteriota bacterium]